MVNAADGSIAALLGASPGASTAVSIMLDLLNRCFAEDLATDEWQAKIREMIPTYGKALAQDSELCKETRTITSKVLKIENTVVA
ncbi:putative malate:quinone oxidoreductase [compost metagenome]